MTAPLNISAFHRCASAIAEAFRRNDGERTRDQFRDLCYAHKMDLLTMQVFFEAAGMRAIRLTPIAPRLGDRFVWEAWRE